MTESVVIRPAVEGVRISDPGCDWIAKAWLDPADGQIRVVTQDLEGHESRLIMPVDEAKVVRACLMALPDLQS